MPIERTNPNPGSSPVREAAGRFREARAHASDRMADASDRMTEIYDEASHWVQDNRGKAFAALGVLAAVGVIGFLLGRNLSRSEELEDL